MAEIVYMPTNELKHNCQDEISVLEKAYFTGSQMYLPKDTVVKCSCSEHYKLTEDLSRSPESANKFRSFFIGNTLFWARVKR